MAETLNQCDEDAQTFGRQCAESGLLVWQCTMNGSMLPAPWLQPRLHAWASSPRLVEMIGTALASGGDGNSRSIELYPGCWMACALDSTSSGPLFWVMLTLTDAALNGATFDHVCAAAGISPEHAAEALRPFIKYSSVQKDQAVATFVRFHEQLTTSRNDRDMISQFTARLSQAYEELNLFFRLARSLNANGKPLETVQLVCRELQEILPFKWVAASFVGGTGKVPELDGRTLIAGSPPCMPAALEQQVASACSDQSRSPWLRIHNPSKSALANIAGGQVIAELLTDGAAPLGALLAGGKAGPDAEVTSEELALLSASAGLIGIFHENVALFAEQQARFIATVRSLAASIDAKDRYTRGHSERVSLLGAALARALGMDEKTIEEYRVAGLLHDVGKIGTPEAILTKTGRLTDEEFRQVMLHPQIGYEILKEIPGLSSALPGVLHHHEKFDGTGYPSRLAGESIPLIARVLALADTFDAMRSNRSYRSARPHDAVIAEIRRCSGTQFDPKLAEVFIQIDFTEFDQMLSREAKAALAA